MPWATADQLLEGATGIFPDLRPVPEPDPTFGQVIGAAFRQHNVVASASVWLFHQLDRQKDLADGYNALVDEDLTGLELYADQFADARSHEDYLVIRDKIERELRDVDILDRAGILGTLATVGATVLDPIMFVPVGGWAGKTFSLGRVSAELSGATVKMTTASAKRYAAQYARDQIPKVSKYAAQSTILGTGVIGASEAALFYTQRTRPSEQVLTTIAAGSILSALLGTGAGLVQRRRFGQMLDEFALGLREVPPPAKADTLIQLELADSASKPLVKQELKAAEHQMFFEDTPITSTVRMDGTHLAKIVASRQEAGEVANVIRMIDALLEGFPKKRMAKEAPKAASAWDRIAAGAATEGDLADLARGGETLMKPFSFINPAMRMAVHPLVEVRKIMQELRPAVFLTRGNFADLANGDNAYSAAQSWLGRTAANFRVLRNDLYPAYVSRMKSLGQRPINYTEFSDEIGNAMVRKDTHIIPEVAQSAKAGRELFEHALAEAREVGIVTEKEAEVLLKGAQSYFPRLLLLDKVRSAADRSAFVNDMSAAIIAKNKPMTQSNSRRLAWEYLETYERNSRIGDPRAGHARFFRERDLIFDETMMDKWFERNYERAMDRFMRAVGPDIELTRRFGSIEPDELLAGLAKRANRWINEEGLTARQVAKRKRQAKAADRDIRQMWAEIRGTASMPDDVTAVGPRVLRGLRQFSHSRVGLGVGLASLVDPAYIVQSTSLTSTLRGTWARFGAGMTPALKAMAREELELMDQSLELVLHGMTKERFGLIETTLPITKVEKFMNTVTHGVNWASGAIPWNHAMRQISGLASLDNILKESANLVRGRIKPIARAKLNRVGVDKAWAERIVDQFKLHGATTDGGLRLSNTMAWVDDTAAANRLRRAVSMSSDMGVMKPLPGDRSIWMTSQLGQMLSQYMSFGMAATSRVALAGLQQRDFNTASAFIMAMGLGGMISGIKRRLLGREMPDSPLVWATEAIDRSGFTGIFFEFDDLVSNASFGKIGVSAWTGRWGNRYYSPDAMLEGAWGPSGDTIAELLTAIGYPLGVSPDKAGARAVRRIWPGQQLQQFTNLWKQVDEVRID